MAEVNWRLEWFAGFDIDNGGAGVWKLAASGNSRLRAAIALVICTLAKPNRAHRLRWKAAFPAAARLTT